MQKCCEYLYALAVLLEILREHFLGKYWAKCLLSESFQFLNLLSFDLFYGKSLLSIVFCSLLFVAVVYLNHF